MNDPTPAPRSPPAERRFRFDRLLLPLVVAVIVMLALRDQVPAVRDATDRLFSPAEFAARQSCQQAALAAASTPAFARLVAPGRTHHTQGGWYVDDVVIGQMGEGGQEQRFRYSCYLDADARVVKSGRQP
jgi:hypothetical protein